MPNNYLLHYHEISDLPISQVLQVLEATGGLPCREMKVSDFIYHGSEPIHAGCGVYLFKEGKKNGAQNLEERLSDYIERHYRFVDMDRRGKKV